MSINKVTWQQVGHVTEPGRYLFRFGWLTMTSEDLAVWTQFPDASFTLVQTVRREANEEQEATDQTGEYHLGVFELMGSHA